MTLQLGALRDALVKAGSGDELARAAAEEVAGYENRLAGIEGRLGEMQGRLGEMRGAVDAVRSELLLHRSVLAIVVALQIAIFVKLFVS